MLFPLTSKGFAFGSSLLILNAALLKKEMSGSETRLIWYRCFSFKFEYARCYVAYLKLFMSRARKAWVENVNAPSVSEYRCTKEEILRKKKLLISKHNILMSAPASKSYLELIYMDIAIM